MHSEEEVFRAIEKDIDLYVDNNLFFTQGRSWAAISFLYQYEFFRRHQHIAFFENKLPKKDNSFVDYPQSSKATEIVLSKVFALCSEKKEKREKNIYQILFKDVERFFSDPDFFIIMYYYSHFVELCKMYSRGFMDVKVDKNKAIFISRNDDYFRIIAFQEKRNIARQDKAKIVSPAIFHEQLKNIPFIFELSNILHKWFRKTLFFPKRLTIPIEWIAGTYTNTSAKLLAYSDIPIDWNFGLYTINEYRALWLGLLIKSSLVLDWFDKNISQYIRYPLLFIQKRTHWVQELSELTNLNKSKISDMLNDLTFNHKEKNLGAMIQPFVPIFKKYLAVSPLMIYVSPYEGNFLDLQCKINKKSYDEFSINKEYILIKDILVNLEKRESVKVRSRIRLSSDNKNITDIDMVILEKTTASLILLQLKWPIRPKSTLDLFNKDKEIENGIEQASKAYEYVSNNLDIFMKNQFSDEKDINIQKINSLVVVRDNIGTSAIYGKNIPVVDYDYFISQISNLDRAIIKIVENAIGHPYLPKKDKDFKVVRRKIQIANYLLEFPIAEMD